MHAIQTSPYSQAWRALGDALPRPKAILCVSAHWYVPYTAVTAMSAPRTIHDFGGFPRELFAVRYPAPGDPQLAERIAGLLAPVAVERDTAWGLDHGTWSVLVHMYPDASIPVVQLSIDERQPERFHFDAGRKLAALRDEGVLVMASGNVVHNLEALAWGNPSAQPYDWALRFDASVRDCVAANENEALIAYETLGEDALLAVPTPDHYLPLLYILGARREGDAVTFPVEGIDGGSISMRSMRLG